MAVVAAPTPENSRCWWHDEVDGRGGYSAGVAEGMPLDVGELVRQLGSSPAAALALAAPEYVVAGTLEPA